MKNLPLMFLAGIALMACTPADEPADTASTTTPSTAPLTDPAAAPPPATPPPTDTAADTCNMAQYTVLVGKPSTDPGVPAAGATVRIIRPGDQVTMDHQPTRLNIEIGANGNVTAVRCG
jgi:hypothetical protein